MNQQLIMLALGAIPSNVLEYLEPVELAPFPAINSSHGSGRRSSKGRQCGLALTGSFLERHALQQMPAARLRLLARLERA